MKNQIWMISGLAISVLVYTMIYGLDPRTIFPSAGWSLAIMDSEEEPGSESVHPDTMRPEDLHEAIGVIGEMHPELGEWLKKLQDEHPRHIARSLHGRFPRLKNFIELKHADPEMFELRMKDIRYNRQCQELARNYRDAQAASEQEEVIQIHDHLALLVNEHFELRQQIKKQELTRLQMRIERLQEQLLVRSETKKELISDRIEELTGSGNDVKW